MMEDALSQPWSNYQGEASYSAIMSGQPDTHKASCHREWLIIALTKHIGRVGCLGLPGFI